MAPSAVRVQFDSQPTAMHRDWLAAIGRAGTRVEWSSRPLPAFAVSDEPLADPRRPDAIDVAAPVGTPVALSDGSDVLIRGVADASGRRFVRPATATSARVRVGMARGISAPPDSLVLRRLLVIGRAGWESEFVIDALEERGWSVDARIHVAPRADVTTGQPSTPDTGRYAVVILLDSSAARVPSAASYIGSYVASGGGLVVAGSANHVVSLVPLTGSTAGPYVGAESLMQADSGPRRSVGLFPLTDLRPDAVALERQGEHVAVVARRLSVGRVLQVGYDETWRWRLRGAGGTPGDPVAAHRDWWTRAVASVAYAPVVRRSRPPEVDAAPLASLLDALGPSMESGVAPGGHRGTSRRPAAPPTWGLAAVLGIGLVCEWASRRLRGAA